MSDTMDIRTFFQATPNLFATAGKGRGSNDAANKQREKILVDLYHSTDPSLQDLRTKWRSFLPTLCSETYDDVFVKLRGGRGANYDFEISFLHGGACVKSIHAEFKHNAARIDKLPEYFSPAADKPYLPRLYADAFYESLDDLCEVYPGLSAQKPDRETYVRLVHNDDYDRHPFFRMLYTMEKEGTKEQYTQKQTLVRESIRKFLDTYGSNLDLSALSKDIRVRQSGKVFILWTLTEFKSDSLREEEMEITHVDRVKNGNTLVVVSKFGTKHNMLLRWKNHLGILYPAWQISLTR